jgi:hypothetical protein
VNRWGKDQTGLIEYQFNQQGFRHVQDYNWKPSIAIFGNSIVFGVGVNYSDILCNLLPDTQNYGLSGTYMNHHSVTNLKEFISSDLYSNSVKIVFFWINRDEPIEDMIQDVNLAAPNVLHISSGIERTGAINLMPSIDYDVSGTHPGTLTHRMWARTIKLLLYRG